MLVASVTGILTLWDLRFGLLIKSWKVGVGAPDRPVMIYSIIIHPTKGRGRWVVVASEALPAAEEPSGGKGTILLEVWDVETSTLVETFKTKDDTVVGSSTSSDTSPQPTIHAVRGQEAQKDPAAAIRNLLRLSESSEVEFSESSPSSLPPPRELLDVCAMVGGADFAGLAGMPRTDVTFGGEERVMPRGGGGYIITGSEDRRIRLWDLTNTERSVVLSGPDNDKASFS